MNKRSIGFSTLVHIDEQTLFNLADRGIVEAGMRAVKIDLDIPQPQPDEVECADDAILIDFVWVEPGKGNGELLAVICYRCPSWFEPVKRRLALNNLEWIEANGINNVEDFDPWSKKVIEAHQSYRLCLVS